jgi:DNA polymerase III epsilon subunit-like protein
VGIIKVRGEKVEDAKDIHVKWPDAPHLSISKRAALVTKFNPQLHDRLAISPKEAFDKFWPILQEADHIVAHNGLNFDLYLLKGYAEMMGVPWKWIVPKFIDTKAIAQGIKMGIRFDPKNETFMEYQWRMANAVVKGIKTNLKLLGSEYGIVHDYENLHDAIVDLELNLKIWNKQKFQIEI